MLSHLQIFKTLGKYHFPKGTAYIIKITTWTLKYKDCHLVLANYRLKISIKCNNMRKVTNGARAQIAHVASLQSATYFLYIPMTGTHRRQNVSLLTSSTSTTISN